MTSKLLILVLGVSLSSVSFAQSAADVRAELKSLNQSLQGVTDLTAASKSTKDSVLNQLTKIQSEVSEMDLSKAHCAGMSCANMKQELQKRISTAIDSAKHPDMYSPILLEQALTGLDTDLLSIQSPDIAAPEAGHLKVRNKHAKLDCTPIPPDAVFCNGELYKKNNSMVNEGLLKAVSNEGSNGSPFGADHEASGVARANEAL
jgi:hypothetical protein